MSVLCSVQVAFPPFYHRLVSPTRLAIAFTITMRIKLITELNTPTAVDRLNWPLIRPILYTYVEIISLVSRLRLFYIRYTFSAPTLITLPRLMISRTSMVGRSSIRSMCQIRRQMDAPSTMAAS